MPAREDRPLPKKRNPLLAADRTPEHSELAARRRLGQTNLSVKPGQVGTSNATKPENLGMFDYAHLRAPLPENLKGSEIFAPQPKQQHPEAYFLMRRSNDGYVSATGMFKASFPWAKHSEESAEREHLKQLDTTAQDEVAGNVWIPEAFALELAEDYGITPWIRALLDDAPVYASSDDKKSISPPPKFQFKGSSLPPPTATPSGRGRGRPRASSPTKSSAPGTKAMTPRKPRQSKAAKEANAAASREVSASLQAALDTAVSLAETESVAETEGDKPTTDGEKVTIEVDESIEVNGEIETTHTTVKVEMPAGSPDLPLPESTEEMIARAKEMVEEAKKLEGEASSSGSKKRKAMMLDDDEDSSLDNELQPAKKARLLEQEVRKQKVRNRALLGVAVTLAVGAMVPFMLGS